MLRVILDEKEISTYKLEKMSNVSHATLLDLYNEKTNIEKCSTALLHEVAKALNMSMDDLFDLLAYKNLSLFTFNEEFDLFKSNLCHELKERGEKEFLKKYLSNNDVIKYFEQNRYPESLYLLSMIDYLCQKFNLPLPLNYQHIRIMKLKKIYVSKSIYLLLQNKQVKVSDLYKESIPVFLKHNIVEADLYDIA